MTCFKCGAKATHSACLQCGQCMCDVCRRRYSGDFGKPEEKDRGEHPKLAISHFPLETNP
jgi:hypothetical protein